MNHNNNPIPTYTINVLLESWKSLHVLGSVELVKADQVKYATYNETAPEVIIEGLYGNPETVTIDKTMTTMIETHIKVVLLPQPLVLEVNQIEIDL